MKRRATCISYVVLLLILLGANAGHAQTPATDESGQILLTEGLLLARSTRPGRTPLHRDCVEALLLEDPNRIFSEGDSVDVSPDLVRTWESVSADENGRFAGQQYVGSYLQFIIDCDEPRIMLLDAHGHSSAVINGQPRGGDPYSWWHQLPVQLNQGRNQLLIQVGRGQFHGKLVPPEKPVFLTTSDQTLPDWLRGRSEPVWAAMPVLNASNEPLTDLEIHTSVSGAQPRATPVGPILPLALRKVGFEICPPQDMAGDEVSVEVKLVRNGQSDPIDVKEIKLSVRNPSERHRRTFVSRMDGSVQYYAVTPALPSSETDSAKPGIYLSLHGAGVEAAGQAAVYQPKSDGHVIAPTNRRSYGFDWEDWGRGDALEVLADAMRQYDVDPQRIFLTGHSMGGHGTWHLGATYPDRFAAIGPSAGWISFWSYAAGKRTQEPSPIVELLERAANPSDTLQLARNYASYGVYILHGDRDDNVPVEQARTMRKVLAEFHPDFAYHEQRGAGHWWGNPCCDWPPMFEFFGHHRAPPSTLLDRIDFTTVCPAVSDKYGWATIVDQVRPLLSSRIELQLDRTNLKLSGTTDNVAILHLNLPLAFSEPSKDKDIQVDLDGTALELPVSDLWLARSDNTWRPIDHPSLANKGPHRYGLLKSAFDHQFLLVYGTGGTSEENQWALSKVRYDAETFWYRGNGSVDILADDEFAPDKTGDRSVILYGNADTNSAWHALLGDCPLRLTREAVSLGDKTVADPRIAALFVYPRKDSDRALIGVVGGTGIEGLRSTARLRYFVSGVAYPDLVLLSADFLKVGNDALIAAGYWNSQWQIDGAEIVWREP